MSRQDLRLKYPTIQPTDLPHQSSSTIFHSVNLDCAIGTDHEHIHRRARSLGRHARQGVKAAEGVSTVTWTALSGKINVRGAVEMGLRQMRRRSYIAHWTSVGVALSPVNGLLA
jgi:hypothetical protein